MVRPHFLLLISLVYPAGVAVALDSDRNQPAKVIAQDIEIDFDTGRRTYRGDVTIQQGTLHMAADEIHLFFDDDVLERAIAHGQPAVFRQQPEGSDHLIRGQAKKIEIDEVEKIAIFSGEGKLQQQRDMIMGETIIFHMETEKIQCLSDCQMTVRDDIAMPDQTERLSTSGAAEIDKMSNLDTPPKVFIQQQPDETPEESADILQEPSNLSITNVTGEKSSTLSVNTLNANKEELESSGNSNPFRAARVISAGTAAYDGPGAGAALLGGLSSQIPVKVLEIRNNWARVAVPSGINVWVYSSYVVENNNDEVRINGRGVRARSLPSTNSHIVGVFESGTRVRVLATRGNWKQVSLPSSIASWVPMTQLEMLNEINSVWQRDWITQAGFLPNSGN